jgi:hypothetical protein
MKRIAALMLFVALSLAGSMPAHAENRKIGENAVEAKRAAKQQQKYGKKQAKRQRKAAKRAQKAQKRVAKRQHSR